MLIHPPVALIKSSSFLLSEELSILCDITNHLPSKTSPGCLAEGRFVLSQLQCSAWQPSLLLGAVLHQMSVMSCSTKQPVTQIWLLSFGAHETAVYVLHVRGPLSVSHTVFLIFLLQQSAISSSSLSHYSCLCSFTLVGITTGFLLARKKHEKEEKPPPPPKCVINSPL